MCSRQSSVQPSLPKTPLTDSTPLARGVKEPEKDQKKPGSLFTPRSSWQSHARLWSAEYALHSFFYVVKTSSLSGKSSLNRHFSENKVEADLNNPYYIHSLMRDEEQCEGRLQCMMESVLGIWLQEEWMKSLPRCTESL